MTTFELDIASIRDRALLRLLVPPANGERCHGPATGQAFHRFDTFIPYFTIFTSYSGHHLAPNLTPRYTIL